MSADSNVPKDSYPIEYGLPPRPPTASTPLWEHLLRPKDRATTSIANMSIIAPPLGPLDKNATSMRVLLHDTQAHFEKFGKHVGQLFEEVKETKQEMKAMHLLFERDREGLTGDIIDLVNRSQNEIQKSVGTPSQYDTVETLSKDLNHRLTGLDQRLDAIQAFNQTHNQTLQTQMQAVQILLDKQGTIIAAVLPLLPLLQAVPLHIDAAKSSISESLSELLTHKSSGEPAPTISTTRLAVLSPQPHTGKRKRTDAETSSSPTPPMVHTNTPYKKRRTADVSNNSLFERGSVPTKPNTHKSPICRGTSTADLSPGASSSSSRRGAFAIPTFVTPRRPLSDLPIPPPLPPSRQSSARGNSTLLNHREAQEPILARSNTLTSALSMVGLPGLTPTAVRPARILRSCTPFSTEVLGSPSGTALPFAVPPEHSTTLSNISRAITPLHEMPFFAGNAQLSGPGIPPRNILTDKHLELFQHNPAAKTVKAEAPQDCSVQIQPPPKATGLSGASYLKPKSTSIVPSAAKLGKLKDRRSPVREGRRFIPLVDSEDEEEEEM